MSRNLCQNELLCRPLTPRSPRPRGHVYHAHAWLKLALLALIIGIAAPAEAKPTGLAEAQSNGDLLHVPVTEDRILVRWNGQLSGMKFEDGTVVGGGLLDRTRRPTVSSIIANAPPHIPLPKVLMGFDPSTQISGWVCAKHAVHLLLSPEHSPIPESLVSLRIEAQEIAAMVALKSAPHTGHIGSCATDEQGRLFLVFVAAATQDPTKATSTADVFAALPFEGRSSILPQGLFHPRTSSTARPPLSFPMGQDRSSNAPNQPMNWGVLWPHVPGSSGPPSPKLTILDDNLVPMPTQDLSDIPPEAEPGTERFVARHNQVISSNGHGLTLTTIDPAGGSHVSTRLPVNPCSEEQLCGLSLAADGTWAAVGYWGAYVGRGTSFRRATVSSFSGERDTIGLAHSGAPGTIAIFGSDDSSIEPLPIEVTASTNLGPHATTPSELGGGYAAAWLRPGMQILATDETLLDHVDLSGSNDQPLDAARYGHRHKHRGSAAKETAPTKKASLVLTKSGFDPKRHIAFERAQPLEALPAPRQPGNSAPPLGTQGDEGLWWQERLALQESSELLRVAGVAPMPVKLAILDSGVDLNHGAFKPFPDTPTLLDSPNPTEIGFDFVDEDTEPQDTHGHGTHVTGLAKPDFSGFRNVHLVVVRVLDDRGRSNSINIGRGFYYAARQGARVINASWGGGPRTQFMADAIAAAQSQAGALVVTSAGNDGMNIDKDPPVPGVFPGVISIASMTRQGRRSGFSNYGRKEVFAFLPGQDITSFALGGGQKTMSGTSMAAPLFSAHAAAGLGILEFLERGSTPMSPASRRQALLNLICESRHTAPRSSSTGGLGNQSECGAMLPMKTFQRLLDLPPE